MDMHEIAKDAEAAAAEAAAGAAAGALSALGALADDQKIDAARAVREGWNLFKAHPVAYVGFVILLTVLQGATAFATTDDGDRQLESAIWYLAVWVVMYPLRFGIMIAGLDDSRGVFSFGSFFKGFHWYFPLVAIDFATKLMVWSGYLMCIIPGVWLSVIWTLVPYIRVEFSPQIGILDAFSLSYRAARRSFWQILLLWVFSVGILILGVLACVVGVFAAIPIVGLTWVAAFEQVFGHNIGHRVSRGCAC